MILGLAQLSNRFNATFLSDLDDFIQAANAEADHAPGACPINYPRAPLIAAHG